MRPNVSKYSFNCRIFCPLNCRTVIYLIALQFLEPKVYVYVVPSINLRYETQTFFFFPLSLTRNGFSLFVFQEPVKRAKTSKKKTANNSENTYLLGIIDASILRQLIGRYCISNGPGNNVISSLTDRF